MSSNVVLPVFSGVENRTAAAALSEPFVQPDAFQVQFDREGFAPVSLGTDDLVAIGADYIGDGEQNEFAYAMHPLLTAPYAAAQAFVDGYGRRIGGEQVQEDKIREILSDEHVES